MLFSGNRLKARVVGGEVVRGKGKPVGLDKVASQEASTR